MPDGPQTPEIPERVALRIPGIALLAAFALAVAATPFAVAAPGLQVVFVLPVAVAYWVLRNRTTVDGERIVARSTFGSRTMEWSTVTSLRVTERSWVRAVLADGREVPLPAVRVRHLPILAVVSGGRFADPARKPAAADEDAGVEASDDGHPDITEHTGTGRAVTERTGPDEPESASGSTPE